MQNTLPFDNPPPPTHGLQQPASNLARRSDPETSHEAAQEVTDSGSADQQRSIVAALVRKYPSRTSDELAQLTPRLDRWQAARRLPEVERAGLIQRGEARHSEVSGRKGVTWWPVRK